jgi:HAD superfamily hydrolase (TIGR01509 family)
VISRLAPSLPYDHTTTKLVIFDCDGVLVDSEAISNAVMAASITAAGLPTTAEEVAARYQSMRLAEIGATIERQLGKGLGEAFWDQFDEDRTAAFQSSLKAVDGASETLAAIQSAGISTCVASQARLSKTKLTLGLTGLRRLFADSELFSADTVPRGKPFPDLFLHAASALGVAARDCAVVEDSSIGIRAALAAGMQAIAYVPPGATPPSRDPAVTTVDHLTQLTKLLTRTRNIRSAAASY